MIKDILKTSFNKLKVYEKQANLKVKGKEKKYE